MAINIEWQVIGGSEGQVRWFTRQGQCTCPSDPLDIHITTKEVGNLNVTFKVNLKKILKRLSQMPHGRRVPHLPGTSYEKRFSVRFLFPLLQITIDNPIQIPHDFTFYLRFLRKDTINI